MRPPLRTGVTAPSGIQPGATFARGVPTYYHRLPMRV
jgi:hypothetical protein